MNKIKYYIKSLDKRACIIYISNVTSETKSLYMEKSSSVCTFYQRNKSYNEIIVKKCNILYVTLNKETWCHDILVLLGSNF